MATTPIYGFVTPDLATTADGPAAMSALALRVEREMSTFRTASTHSLEETAITVTGLDEVQVQSVTVPTSVIGWITIEWSCMITTTTIVNQDPSGIGLAGFVNLYVDDVLVRHRRWHNQWGTRTLYVAAGAATARTAAQTSTNLKAKIDLTTGSSAVDCFSPSFYVAQYGAPGSG